MFFEAIKHFFARAFYLEKRVYYIAGSAVVLYFFSYFLPPLFQVASMILVLTAITVLVDTLLLFGKRYGLRCERITQDRWSNGDENKIILHFQNNYRFALQAHVIDEIPVQFQDRQWFRKMKLAPGKEDEQVYFLRPVNRGEFKFGDVNVFVKGPLQLAKRRFVFPAEHTVKVYPSYVQMRRYQLLAVNNKLQEAGVKRMRKLGHSMEFEQIKEYVRGDDYRTINWKATARKPDLMVNNYTDERSQQVYCLVNKGRAMKMPFEGMTLLDYAINASLVLLNVALVKQDRAGLICFSEQVDSFLPADKKPTQMNAILESLYRQSTKFLEPDFEKLYAVVRGRIAHRSLLVMFTNFESLDSLKRELPSLKRLAKYHLLLVVFFENTELKALTEKRAVTIEDIYIKTIAEKFAYEKRLMVRELHKNGILSILTAPENLTVNAINKYLELKNRLSI
jgi:uncharacterized protein (DUF58 family)